MCHPQPSAVYLCIDPNLSARFHSAVDVVLARIAADPDSLPQVEGGFRRVRVQRFPDVIFFKLLDVQTVGV